MILESAGLNFIGGGILRMLPEVLKFFNTKGERKHELEMLKAEMEFARLRGEQEMKRTEAAISMSELDAIMTATKEQGETAKAAGWFAALISSLVRPTITYWFTALYTMAKYAGIQLAIAQGGDWKEVWAASWTQEDMDVYVMILGFWFIGRTVDFVKKRMA